MDIKIQQSKKAQNIQTYIHEYKDNSLSGSNSISNSNSHQIQPINNNETLSNKNITDNEVMSNKSIIRMQGNQNDYNVATFTFGGKTSNILKENLPKKLNKISENKDTLPINSEFKNQNQFGGSLKSKYDGLSYSGFINTKVRSCSYISSVLQLIFNMKYLRDHIQQELIYDDKKFILLATIKVNIFFDIENLRTIW